MRAEIEHTQQSLFGADKVSWPDFTCCLPLLLVGFGSKETSCLWYILCPFIPEECFEGCYSLSPPQVELRLSWCTFQVLTDINRFQNSQNRYEKKHVPCIFSVDRCFTKQKRHFTWSDSFLASSKIVWQGLSCSVPKRVLVGVARLGRSTDQRPVAPCGEWPWISCCFQAGRGDHFTFSVFLWLGFCAHKTTPTCCVVRMYFTIFPGKYHQNGGFSMTMLVYRSVP